MRYSALRGTRTERTFHVGKLICTAWVNEKGSLSIHYLEFPHNSSSR